MECPLCLCSTTLPLDEIEGYRRCEICDLRFLDPRARLQPLAEKARYDLHDNRADDLAYRRFLQPLVDAISVRVPGPAPGLDFGSGPCSLLAEMLCERGLSVALYDPFFHPDEQALNGSYSFITCHEVAEHFYFPQREFDRLWRMLKPGGWLGLSTSLYNSQIDFAQWYYRRDPTHVVFYSRETFTWLARHFAVVQLTLSGERIILLRKSECGK